MNNTSIYKFRVAQINLLTPNIYQIFISAFHELEFTYQAGQYIEILYPNGNFLPFSIANAPNQEGQIELHIRCLNDDVATQNLMNQIKSKHELNIRGPLGRCVYYPSNRPTIFLTGGTGFSQTKALIEQAYIEGFAYPLYLYWGAKKQADFYLLSILKNWQNTFNQFKYELLISQPGLNRWQGKIGYTHLAAIHEHPNLHNYRVYASGPFALVLSAFNLMQQHGLDKNYFHSDMLDYHQTS